MALRASVDAGAGGSLVTSVTGTANQITASPTSGAVVVSFPATFYANAAWTPSDQSGAALTFTNVDATYTRIGNMVFASGHLTYPSTASAASAVIGGLPITVASRTAALGPSGMYITGIVIGAGGACVPQSNTTNLALISETVQGAYKNSDLSTATISFLAIYPAT